MKNVSLVSRRKFEIKNVERPILKKDDDILLKVCLVGICGSDIHYYKEGRIGDQVIEYPFTVGHECVCRVEEVGKSVTSFCKGDLVVVDPVTHCNVCDQCKQGRFHTCRSVQSMGNPGQLEGALSEFIVMPQTCCYRLVPAFDLKTAIIVEPLSIAVQAFQLLKDPGIKKIAILGVGPIGLCVLMEAQTNGIMSIYITDKINHRIQVSKQFEAIWGGNPDELDIVEKILSKEPDGLDAVFECCGDQEALTQSVQLLKPGGTLIIVGIPEVDQVYFNIHELRRKEIKILNVRRQNQCFKKAIDHLKNKKFDASLFVTHVFDLDSVENAFETVANYRDGVIKAVIEFSS